MPYQLLTSSRLLWICATVLGLMLLNVEAYGTTHTINAGGSFQIPEQSPGCGSTDFSPRTIQTGPSHGSIAFLGTTLGPYPVSSFKGNFTSGGTVYTHNGNSATSDQFTIVDDCGTTFTVSITITQPTATAPSITTQPTNTTVCAGTTASFTAAASGTPAPTVQWQVSADGGSTFGNVGGATSATYSFTAAAGDNSNQYRAVFTNSAGTATSNAATLQTTAAPTVTTHPTTQTVCIGYDLTLTAAATGTPAPTVQWEVSTDNGATYAPIPTATNTTYTTTVTAGLDGNRYRAAFSNTCGTTNTNAATITVSPAPTMTVSLNPQIFTSSGGTMRTVFATIGVSGGCSPAVTLQSITSSDADAGTFPGDQANDIQNAAFATDDRQFDLRAEITPPNDDRTYEVTYRVTDGTYTADVTKAVIVPSGIGTLAPGGTNDCGIFLGTLPEMTGPTVNIPYTLNNPTTVRLTIYNTKGKAVYGLVNEVAQSPDAYSVPWDGTNNAGLYPGTQQPNGYYFVLIEGCADYREVGILVVNR